MGDGKLIVFDYDGTLFDTRPAIHYALTHAFAAHGRPLPPDREVATAIAQGTTLDDTLLILDPGLGRDRAALDDLVLSYRALYLDAAEPLLRPYPGVSKALGQLHAMGTASLVVSNKGLAAIHRSLAANGLAAFVAAVYGDEPGLPKKPNPAILTQHVLPRLGQTQRERMLVVGDTATDIMFAKAAGLPCCWVSYGYGAIDRCRALAPEHEISSIDQLPALVARL